MEYGVVLRPMLVVGVNVYEFSFPFPYAYKPKKTLLAVNITSFFSRFRARHQSLLVTYINVDKKITTYLFYLSNHCLSST